MKIQTNWVANITMVQLVLDCPPCEIFSPQLCHTHEICIFLNPMQYLQMLVSIKNAKGVGINLKWYKYIDRTWIFLWILKYIYIKCTSYLIFDNICNSDEINIPKNCVHTHINYIVLFTTAKIWNKSWGQNRQKDKENVVWVQNGILFSHKEERSSVTCHKVDEA
jgi:hypothetical protein